MTELCKVSQLNILNTVLHPEQEAYHTAEILNQVIYMEYLFRICLDDVEIKIRLKKIAIFQIKMKQFDLLSDSQFIFIYFSYIWYQLNNILQFVQFLYRLFCVFLKLYLATNHVTLIPLKYLSIYVYFC